MRKVGKHNQSSAHPSSPKSDIKPKASKKRGKQSRGNVKRKEPELFTPTAIAYSVAESFNEDIGLSTYSCMERGDSPSFEIASFKASYQRSSTLKKFIGAAIVSPEDRRRNAFSKFNDINRHMSAFRYSGLDLPIPSNRPWARDGYSRRDQIMVLAKKFCHQILGDITTEEIFFGCKHSSGSSIGVPLHEVNVQRKFKPPITGTAEAIRLFSSYCNYDNQLLVVLQQIFGSLTFEEVASSRATTVDKDNSRDRFIAVEPTLNMFFQQGLMAAFYKRLRPFVDMTHAQENHRALARLGSLDGSLATIDWSSASDCVSTDLVQYLLPPKWWWWCDLVRTAFVDMDGEVKPCYMFATMGNATTFPLETLVFLCIGYALIQVNRDPDRVHCIPDFRHAKHVSVFGDDCIVPTMIAREYISILTSVGFIVNADKTFVDPHSRFRESCGGDYYRGHPVRPYFITDPHDERKTSLGPWLHVILNRLFQKYIEYFGVDEWWREKRVWRLLASLFRENGIQVYPVPQDYPDDSGFRYNVVTTLEFLGFPIARPEQNRFGFSHIRYYQFRYKRVGPLNHRLRYWLALRYPGQVIDEASQVALKHLLLQVDPIHEPPTEIERSDRKVGRYVVARSWVSNLTPSFTA